MTKTLLLAFAFCTSMIHAQKLKRTATHGVSLRLVDSTIAKQFSAKTTDGMLVQYVLPEGNAAKAGIVTNDIILSINDIALNDFNVFNLPDFKLKEGDKAHYRILRNGSELDFNISMTGRPKEQSETLSFEYGAYSFDEGLIRTIITKDKTTGKKPAILFVPGFTCFSQDNMSINHPYRKLVYTLAENGFLVMRAEKLGLGDSNNKQQCTEIDFDTEVTSYQEALKTLFAHPEVDTNNVFVFGHSLGGMEAPFIAEGFDVKGIVAMGITVKHWREYLLEMLRNQTPRLGVDYLQSEKDIKLYETLLYELLVNKKTPTEMVERNPEYQRILQRDFGAITNDSFLGRNIRFSQSLNDKNSIEAWSRTKAKVLSAWGETDVQVINDFSHRELVEIVNTYHPGNATFLELVDTDHNFLKIKTLEESYRINRGGNIAALLPTHFNYDAVKTIIEWLNKTKE